MRFKLGRRRKLATSEPLLLLFLLFLLCSPVPSEAPGSGPGPLGDPRGLGLPRLVPPRFGVGGLSCTLGAPMSNRPSRSDASSTSSKDTSGFLLMLMLVLVLVLVLVLSVRASWHARSL